jgi:hypothetical protein
MTGRKSKKQKQSRNISGLRNQPKASPVPSYNPTPAAHPDCQALFIFDQSSAHASLPPDALKAFTMNKSNGGAQRKQKNTVIPQSNPDPQFRGVHQEMITPEGEAKGLKDCLEECGFGVSRVKAKTAAWLGCCHSKKTS